MVGRSRPRFAIASEVGRTRRLEAASKKGRMSVISGRTVGSLSQQSVVSSQISSERPRISRFGGREGRSPLRTRPSAIKGETCANGVSCAKTCRSGNQDGFSGECNATRPRK